MPRVCWNCLFTFYRLREKTRRHKNIISRGRTPKLLTKTLFDREGEKLVPERQPALKKILLKLFARNLIC